MAWYQWIRMKGHIVGVEQNITDNTEISSFLWEKESEEPLSSVFVVGYVDDYFSWVESQREKGFYDQQSEKRLFIRLSFRPEDIVLGNVTGYFNKVKTAYARKEKVMRVINELDIDSILRENSRN